MSVDRAEQRARAAEISAAIAIAAPIVGWVALLAVEPLERATGSGAPAALVFFGGGAIALGAFVTAGALLVASRLASTQARWPRRATVLTAIVPASWLLGWGVALAWVTYAALTGPWEFLGAAH